MAQECSENYPNFNEWFYETVIPEVELKNEQREIIIAISDLNKEDCKEENLLVTGIAVLKKTKNEKKICALRIHEDYRNLGIGTKMFEECFEYLGTRKPIITITENLLSVFEGHINDYKFERTQVLENYYINGKTEYVFNGTLK